MTSQFSISSRSVLIDVKTGQPTRELLLLLTYLDSIAADIASLVLIQTVTNGITDKAPSSNAVFDAIADLSSDVTATFLTQANAVATYLPITTAAATYLTQTDASATYLTIVTAAATYLPLAGGVLTGTVRLPNYTVATLPAAGTAGAGALAFVTDASTTLILGLGLAVTGGGSNKVPAYSDGASWLYG